MLLTARLRLTHMVSVEGQVWHPSSLLVFFAVQAAFWARAQGTTRLEGQHAPLSLDMTAWNDVHASRNAKQGVAFVSL